MFIAQQLGRYHLLDRIAYGGMAEIFRAKTFDHEGHVHLVAIKRLFRDLAADDSFLEMLVDEARIASLLDHPNIAKVYEFARVEDEHFLAMEYVDGKDLRAIIEACRNQGTSIPAEHCAYITSCVLDGLQAAHDQVGADGNPLNIVHRDISPSNVIVTYGGEVKLCDFGIAKATLSQVQTRAGVIKGKIRYMSPEQTRGHVLDRRSDIFSLGAVLYEILTLQPAFQAESEPDLILRVREARVPPMLESESDIPDPLRRAISKAMNRSRSARYRNAADLAHDLRKWLGRIAPGYTPVSLSGFMRDLFADAIEDDVRRLQEYVVGEGDPAALGENLIADVTGHDSRFTPLAADMHTDVSAAHAPAPRETRQVSTSTEIKVPLHEAETRLFPLDERTTTVPHPEQRRPARSRELPAASSSTGTHVRAVNTPSDNGAHAKPAIDRSLHDAPTRLISRDDKPPRRRS